MVEENEQIENNAGDPPADDPVTPDPGTTGDDPAADPGTPDPSGGEQTDPRDAQITKLSGEVKALNKAVVDARRDGRANKGNEGAADAPGSNPTAEEYSQSLEIADGRLRGGLEKRLALYPELPEEEKARIRNNPWVFANAASWKSADWETALDEIELTMVDRVEELEKANKDTKPDPQGSPEGGQPANVAGNPAPEGGNNAATAEATKEDLFNMPMDKLEKLAMTAKAKLEAQKK